MKLQALKGNLARSPFDPGARYSIRELTDSTLDELEDSGFLELLADNPILKAVYKDEATSLAKNFKTVKKFVTKFKSATDEEIVALKDADLLKLVESFNELIEEANALLKECDDWEDYKDVAEDARLGQSVRRTEWEGWRDEVVELLGVADKSHSGHGSNFSANQNLAQVIESVVDKVSDKTEAAKKIYKEFGYVIKAVG